MHSSFVRGTRGKAWIGHFTRIAFPSANIHARRQMESSLINKLTNLNFKSTFILLTFSMLSGTFSDRFLTPVAFLTDRPTL